MTLIPERPDLTSESQCEGEYFHKFRVTGPEDVAQVGAVCTCGRAELYARFDGSVGCRLRSEEETL